MLVGRVRFVKSTPRRDSNVKEVQKMFNLHEKNEGLNLNSLRIVESGGKETKDILPVN